MLHASSSSSSSPSFLCAFIAFFTACTHTSTGIIGSLATLFHHHFHILWILVSCFAYSSCTLFSTIISDSMLLLSISHLLTTSILCCLFTYFFFNKKNFGPVKQFSLCFLCASAQIEEHNSHSLMEKVGKMISKKTDAAKGEILIN